MTATAVPAKPARAAQKGQQTKAVIVDAALALAAQIGLEGLSIGAVAEITKMSKSGVFAHFGSREELQISVVREYHVRFEQEVFFPALKAAAARPAAPARHVRQLDEAHLHRDRFGLHLHQRRLRIRRPAGPGARRAGESVSIWQAAVLRAIVQSQAKAICAPTPTSARWGSRSTA
jgi:AcrR family transcriptional regulator